MATTRRYRTAPLSRPRLGNALRQLLLWAGLTTIALWIFIDMTEDLVEGQVLGIDRVAMLWMAQIRSPWLTVAALDVTALGSVTLVALFSAFTLVVLLALRDRMGALQLLCAALGSAALTALTKDIVERPRPSLIPRLVEVSGFSWPSGHSASTTALYVTIGIIAARHVLQPRARIMVFLAISVVLVLVGLSRIYLGVHYPTDVAGGISLGLAWSLLLAGFFAVVDRRRAGSGSLV